MGTFGSDSEGDIERMLWVKIELLERESKRLVREYVELAAQNEDLKAEIRRLKTPILTAQ
jgi:cell division protein FtsB